eukprot:TRINITY_DN6106_c0_g1_i1.p1 TRINITY_DN6106_c0_g1~~TRINITY_DN6106_c0_g1_i1.p1  ORF type:complete len:483 (+),score=207.21 TRINITY_DN6106_c0_g1_i1:143-1591(+)
MAFLNMERAVSSAVRLGLLKRTGVRWASAAAAPEPPATPVEEPWDLEKKIVERSLTPVCTVQELDKYIIGQDAAKRAVAISLRNRWRRVHVADKDLKADIQPKNILMVGPTGVGKTEISRRMAKLTDAPFIKVEATKFTEVGFKGRDVDSIIEDLYQAALQKARSLVKGRMQGVAKETAINIVLSKLAPTDQPAEMEKYKQMLLDGQLDSTVIEYTLGPEQQQGPRNPVDTNMRQQLSQSNVLVLGKTRRVKGTVKEALKEIEADELEKILDNKQVAQEAQDLAENHGIVFLDEIDKVVTASKEKRVDASAEGVQQDLLPLIEGSVVNLKDGTSINTQNMLFICSGAFHLAKPSDMIAELQGRLPVRVELSALTENDFYRILTEPAFNLVRQNIELLRTEDVHLEFTDRALRKVAQLTSQLNSELQNIGARRLMTVIEKIVEDISFEAEDYAGKNVVIDEDYVQRKIKEIRDKASDPLRSII